MNNKFLRNVFKNSKNKRNRAMNFRLIIYLTHLNFINRCSLRQNLGIFNCHLDLRGLCKTLQWVKASKHYRVLMQQLEIIHHILCQIKLAIDNCHRLTSNKCLCNNIFYPHYQIISKNRYLKEEAITVKI